MAKQKRRAKTHPDTYFILVGFSVVMFWRGAWGLMDLYLFPDNPTLSFSVSLLAGILILFFINRKKLRDLG